MTYWFTHSIMTNVPLHACVQAEYVGLNQYYTCSGKFYWETEIENISVSNTCALLSITTRFQNTGLLDYLLFPRILSSCQLCPFFRFLFFFFKFLHTLWAKTSWLLRIHSCSCHCQLLTIFFTFLGFCNSFKYFDIPTKKMTQNSSLVQ